MALCRACSSGVFPMVFETALTIRISTLVSVMIGLSVLLATLPGGLLWLTLDRSSSGDAPGTPSCSTASDQ